MKFDDSDFQRKVKQLTDLITQKKQRALYEVGLEVLRISNNRLVPLNKGTLMNSGHLEPTKPADEILVGYNTPYAARLHEHPEYKFQKGRVGKYLERAIVDNIEFYRKHIQKALKL